jgi:hypothetical protein
MYKAILYLFIAVAFISCRNDEPNKSIISVYDVESTYAPTLKVELDNQDLHVLLKMGGETLIDSVHLLNEAKKKAILAHFSANGIRVYSQETPEWKDKKSNDMSPEQWNNVETVFYPELEYVLEYYHTLLQAANSLNKITPSFLEKSDTFAAD